MEHHRRSPFSSLRKLANLAAAVLVGVALASPVAADWLVTVRGKLIETRGPWTLEGTTLSYTDLAGESKTLQLDEIDLEGSYLTTEMKTGKPVPRPPVAAVPTPRQGPEVAAKAPGVGEEPKVILYQTSWCGYCRKARKLLKQLDCDFVAKDIERSRKAARELRQKVGKNRGVPVLDIGGKLVLGYNEPLIRRLVRTVQEQE